MRPPGFPVRGEILTVQVPQGLRPLLSRCVRGTARGVDVHLVPRSHGELVIGATAQGRGDRTVTVRGAHQLLHAAIEVLPAVADLPFGEVFAALRPGSPDNGPMIGACAVPGLVMATGHHRNGVLLTPITADAVVATVVGDELDEEMAAFPSGRFAA